MLEASTPSRLIGCAIYYWLFDLQDYICSISIKHFGWRVHSKLISSFVFCVICIFFLFIALVKMSFF
ncbi:hypothetical protein Hanom_Chr04g00301531 [Helianthus anomalus]